MNGKLTVTKIMRSMAICGWAAGALFGTHARADIGNGDNCFALDMRVGTQDVGTLCVDPLLDADNPSIRKGLKVQVHLYASDELHGPYFLKTLDAKIVAVYNSAILGPSYTIEGADAVHNVWIDFGSGSPPSASGILEYLADGHKEKIGRYVGEPRPAPSVPRHCPQGHGCK